MAGEHPQLHVAVIGQAADRFVPSDVDEQVCEAVLVERKTEELERRPAWQRWFVRARYARDIARHRERLNALNAMAGTTVDFQSFFNEGGDEQADALALRGAKSWAEHTELMYSLCRAAGIDALFVVQPIPDRGKTLTDSERAHLRVYPEIVAARAAGYERLLAHADELRGRGCPVVSFEQVFSERQESVYTDLIHFEDRGSRIVAERLVQDVVARWPAFTR